LRAFAASSRSCCLDGHHPIVFRRRCVGHGSRRLWFIDGTGAAVQIFDCSGLLCGRIIWLEKARDTAGRLARDDKNPDPIFRQRPLCGLTVLEGLQPAGLDHWNSGSLYRSTDLFVARIYLGVPLFGETRTLLRVPRLRSEGWC
jgi:hypothetical protein